MTVKTSHPKDMTKGQVNYDELLVNAHFDNSIIARLPSFITLASRQMTMHHLQISFFADI